MINPLHAAAKAAAEKLFVIRKKGTDIYVYYILKEPVFMEGLTDEVSIFTREEANNFYRAARHYHQIEAVKLSEIVFNKQTHFMPVIGKQNYEEVKRDTGENVIAPRESGEENKISGMGESQPHEHGSDKPQGANVIQERERGDNMAGSDKSGNEGVKTEDKII